MEPENSCSLNASEIFPHVGEKRFHDVGILVGHFNQCRKVLCMASILLLGPRYYGVIVPLVWCIRSSALLAEIDLDILPNHIQSL